MADKTLRTRVGLRRDDAANFESSFLPLSGELLFVNTENDGVRVKLGDGVTQYSELPFLDTVNNIVVWGYYLNGKFYTDTTYTVELEKTIEHIYIDKISSGLYVYDSTKKEFVGIDSMVSPASNNKAGILKLYSTEGQNTDGTMTQKAITDGIDGVEFAIDDQDEECLILDKPW